MISLDTPIPPAHPQFANQRWLQTTGHQLLSLCLPPALFKPLLKHYQSPRFGRRRRHDYHGLGGLSSECQVFESYTVSPGFDRDSIHSGFSIWCWDTMPSMDGLELDRASFQPLASCSRFVTRTRRTRPRECLHCLQRVRHSIQQGCPRAMGSSQPIRCPFCVLFLFYFYSYFSFQGCGGFSITITHPTHPSSSAPHLSPMSLPCS